jgi:ABC-2 type transport system ATP-binding protein
MSGLDPIGRREVRELILRLRDRGCTVFFSSHVLSDAEALCSRVAIVVKGRLVANGSIDELTAFRAQGWELVVSGMSDDVLKRAQAGVSTVTSLGGGRFALELPLTTPPERIIPELVKSGASIVSLNPVRATLEDFFIAQVRAAKDDRTLGNDVVDKRAAS